jgi:hypothetical protein
MKNKQAWRPRWFAWGLVGFADIADGDYNTIDHQKSKIRTCEHAQLHHH